jgi:hypothetical protein
VWEKCPQILGHPVFSIFSAPSSSLSLIDVSQFRNSVSLTWTHFPPLNALNVYHGHHRTTTTTQCSIGASSE